MTCRHGFPMLCPTCLEARMVRLSPVWKPKRFYPCFSSMPLWLGLETLAVCQGERNLTREEYKAAIQSFPGPSNGCRCKDCRYYRVLKGARQ